MIRFAETCDAVAATPAKSLKIERLAAYFRTLEPADLAAAARFTSGKPLGAADDRKLAIGGRTILAAARRAWSIDDAALSAGYRETGDLGEALGPLLREPAVPSLFRETLTPGSLGAILDELASAGWPRGGKEARTRLRAHPARLHDRSRSGLRHQDTDRRSAHRPARRFRPRCPRRGLRTRTGGRAPGRDGCRRRGGGRGRRPSRNPRCDRGPLRRARGLHAGLAHRVRFRVSRTRRGRLARRAQVRRHTRAGAQAGRDGAARIRARSATSRARFPR